MSMPQVSLLWIMMIIQGGRRLIESISFGRRSSSTMWIAHWAVGIAFYVATSVAIWIEGLCRSPRLFSAKCIADFALAAIRSWDRAVESGISTLPTIRACIGILLFIFASGIQHDCHAYLATLKKYSLPNHPIFRLIICPHYTAECAIYLSMVIAGAPRGAAVNPTMMCALLFVAVNLGVTAAGTREWYANKFGPQAIHGRWIMLPGLW